MKRKTRTKIALGFDETNNGFSILHAPFLIVTGVLGPDRRGYGTVPYGSKSNRRFFGRRETEKDEILKCVRNYLKSRTDFFYTVIPRPEKRKGSYEVNVLKSQAISSICLKFFDSLSIPESTPIYIHQIDGLRESTFVEDSVRSNLHYAGISFPNVRVLKSSKRNMKEVIKDADMIGYYLAALKFLLKPKKWPFKDNRVPLRSLDDLIMDRISQE